jgi:uncharacterized membrane protein YphA (DoxX/SURF4 family)
MPFVRALTDVLSARTPSVPVAACRIGLGVAALGRSLKTARDLYLLQHDPSVVPAPVVSWAPRFDTTFEIGVMGGIGILASICLIAGYRARLAAAVLAAGIGILYFVDQNFWGHHMYFMALMLLLLSLTDSDAALSVRAWREEPLDDVLWWPVLLMKIQLSLVYFFSGAAKLNPVFLSGGVLTARTSLPGMADQELLAATFAIAAVTGELFLAVALWFRQLRPWGILVGLGLHALVPVLLGFYAGLIVFSVASLAIYPLFADTRDMERMSRSLSRFEARAPA